MKIESRTEECQSSLLLSATLHNDVERPADQKDLILVMKELTGPGNINGTSNLKLELVQQVEL